jgi:Na+/H+ antiporter NhaD/arsenite permease-like protein
MTPTMLAAAAIFILTYTGVALGRIPGLRLDRAGIALTGAALMLAAGALTPGRLTAPSTSIPSRCCSA